MKHCISRRALLRGTGVSLALPLLEAMQPRLARAAAAASAPPRRMIFLYASTGVAVPAWAPTGEGSDYQLSPTLAGLADLRDDVLVLSGLDHRRDDRTVQAHDTASSTLLSTAPIGERDRSSCATGISVDQLAAQRIGSQTRLPSLEIGCDERSDRIHISNISWRGRAMPMGREVLPSRAFKRLFGDPRGDTFRRSILDYVMDSAKRLRRELGVADQQKLDEYQEAIRSLEKRIATAERLSKGSQPPKMTLPETVPEDYQDHIRMMSDLMVLALQTDATRVITFMYANESSDRTFPELGVRETHHTLSHYNPNTADGVEKLEQLKKIDRFYIEQFKFLLTKLKTTPEGQGNLLDSSMLCYASGLSYGNSHSRIDIPVILAGRGGGTIDPGRHVRYPAGTPFSNLLLSMLDRVDVNLDRISDSTGRLPQLTV